MWKLIKNLFGKKDNKLKVFDKSFENFDEYVEYLKITLPILNNYALKESKTNEDHIVFLYIELLKGEIESNFPNKYKIIEHMNSINAYIK